MSVGLSPPGLPERQRVPWRAQVNEAGLRRDDRWWRLTTLAVTVPFIAPAILLVLLRPVLAPVSLILIAHAWAIPALYANRGAGVLSRRPAGAVGPESRALLLLGDLVSDENRRLHEGTGLVLEPGELGTWVVGEAGALLVRRGGHRVNCYCVRVTGPTLPHGDRVAHLLLGLRCGERDFATVANVTFSGAPWRLRRRMAPEQRPALDRAVTQARQVRG